MIDWFTNLLKLAVMSFQLPNIILTEGTKWSVTLALSLILLSDPCPSEQKTYTETPDLGDHERRRSATGSLTPDKRRERNWWEKEETLISLPAVGLVGSPAYIPLTAVGLVEATAYHAH